MLCERKNGGKRAACVAASKQLHTTDETVRKARRMWKARRRACGKQGDEHAGRHIPAVAPEMVTGKAKNLNTCRYAAE